MAVIPNYMSNPTVFGGFDYSKNQISNIQNDGSIDTDFKLGTQGLNFQPQNNSNGLPGLAANSQTASGSGLKFSDMGAYDKMATVGQGVSAFGTLAQLYLGFKAMGAQKKQFNFQKDAYNKNYANSLKDYNNQLRSEWERKSAGHSYFGQDYQSLDEYMSERSLGNDNSKPQTIYAQDTYPQRSAQQATQQPSPINMNYDRKRLIGG